MSRFAVLSLLYRAKDGADLLETAAGLSSSYARALVAEFHARPPVTQGKWGPAAGTTLPEVDPGGVTAPANRTAP